MLPRPSNPPSQPSQPSKPPNIEIQYFTLTIKKTGTGDGLVKSEPGGIYCGKKCSYDFAEGTTVTLSVEPNFKSKFIKWEGDCSNCGQNDTCSLFIDSPKTCEVVLALNEKPKIKEFSVYPSSGYAPLNTLITWIVEDPEHDPITCKLDVNNDGLPEYTIENCGYQSFQKHTFKTPGTYEITLYIQDAVQNQVFKKFKVEVYQPPKPQEGGGGGGCNTAADGFISVLLLSVIGIKLVKKFFTVKYARKPPSVMGE